MFWLVLALTLDQITKHLTTLYIPLGTIKRIYGIFFLTHATNRGISFGLFAGVKEIVIYLTLLIIIGLSTIPLFLKLNKFTQTMLGFILGGALGNLIDRIRYGYVVDFITFLGWPTVFNVADIFITIGTVGLGISFIREELKHGPLFSHRKSKDRSKSAGETLTNGTISRGIYRRYRPNRTDGYTSDEQGRRLETRQIRNGKDSRLDLENVYSKGYQKRGSSGQWDFEEAELQGEVWGYNYLESPGETETSGDSSGEYTT
ncbi:lipoprotein signal peptidase [Fervidobacterium gondwanense DSM 13020]|uniref:Lipoprotein signal peptidase n=1 Tax=Fervidobacterium gondwanense DSM 13020 TaxID=1121883 RepID=A0A1M7T7J4_FERGO|nr:lipoprotein signal peptidase [Fervidobacterium gondwanense DSM 13020]